MIVSLLDAIGHGDKEYYKGNEHAYGISCRMLGTHTKRMCVWWGQGRGK